ncbi:TylF/MycF/NovP-related O-methyltransferase [Streptacidiphilus albus]|uniref:TylF/MycF/NovP-related O-methyltransferase n=1 Tax=Streptacidiphilus albus TaxID=105425 RepID=UPI0005A80BDA|nr:TylF/MycF/NovP-related O-methyltransferase [Streptacidiphilus albus]
MDKIREWLLSEHAGTVCADRLHVVADELFRLRWRGQSGAIVELGCYRGAMALWMRHMLDALGEGEREIHVYDGFAGMPAPGRQDSDHLAEGELRSCPQDVLDTHARWDKKPPVIHPGWFDQTLADELPDTIAFGYLDGDFYASTLTGLRHTVPRLAPGAVLLIDDYADVAANPRAWNGLPGVKHASDAYFGHPSPVEALVGDDDLAVGRYTAPARQGGAST